MRYWTAVFLLLALLAGVIGLSGVDGLSRLGASGLFLAALILALLSALLGHRPQAARNNPSPRRYGGA